MVTASGRAARRHHGFHICLLYIPGHREATEILLSISEYYSHRSWRQLLTQRKRSFYNRPATGVFVHFTVKLCIFLWPNCRYVSEEVWWLICNVSCPPTNTNICTSTCAHTLICTHTQTDLPWWVLWVTVDYRAVKLVAGRRQLEQGISC